MSSDGLVLHAHWPTEGRSHDWTLYMQSEMNKQLEEALLVHAKQYCIYGDSGYTFRVYLEVLFRGLSLSADMSVFKKTISTVRDFAEWVIMEVRLYWTALDFKWKLGINESPAGLLYMAVMLLANL